MATAAMNKKSATISMPCQPKPLPPDFAGVVFGPAPLPLAPDLCGATDVDAAVVVVVLVDVVVWYVVIEARSGRVDAVGSLRDDPCASARNAARSAARCW